MWQVPTDNTQEDEPSQACPRKAHEGAAIPCMALVRKWFHSQLKLETTSVCPREAIWPEIQTNRTEWHCGPVLPSWLCKVHLEITEAFPAADKPVLVVQVSEPVPRRHSVVPLGAPRYCFLGASGQPSPLSQDEGGLVGLQLCLACGIDQGPSRRSANLAQCLLDSLSAGCVPQTARALGISPFPLGGCRVPLPQKVDPTESCLCDPTELFPVRSPQSRWRW